MREIYRRYNVETLGYFSPEKGYPNVKWKGSFDVWKLFYVFEGFFGNTKPTLIVFVTLESWIS